MADPLLEAPGSSDRDFDLASFLNSCLAEDLSASSPPYLLGRALWVASRCVLPEPRPKLTFLSTALLYILLHYSMKEFLRPCNLDIQESVSGRCKMG